jgi:hypothetical protein
MTLEEREDIPHTFKVYYNVDARDPLHPSCDCAAGARGLPCHHILFVLRALQEDE